MGHCDSCGKKFGWREHQTNIGRHVAWVIDQNILLTKFDKPLLLPLEWHGHPLQMYCQKCTDAFLFHMLDNMQ